MSYNKAINILHSFFEFIYAAVRYTILVFVCIHYKVMMNHRKIRITKPL